MYKNNKKQEILEIDSTLFEVPKNVDKVKGHKKIKQRAINKYYDNPNYCSYCNTMLKIPINVKASIVKAKKFCNMTCSALSKKSGKKMFT